MLEPAYQRGSSFQTVYVKLESPEAFARFKDALTTDPRLNLKVLRETDYFAEQSQMVSTSSPRSGAFIAALMGVGRVFGAVNTDVLGGRAPRRARSPTLRALGFGGGPVVCPCSPSRCCCALVGRRALPAAARVSSRFNGLQTSTINWQTFSQVGFAVRRDAGADRSAGQLFYAPA